MTEYIMHGRAWQCIHSSGNECKSSICGNFRPSTSKLILVTHIVAMGFEWAVQSLNINSCHGISWYIAACTAHGQAICNGMGLATCKLHADASYIYIGSLVRIVCEYSLYAE